MKEKKKGSHRMSTGKKKWNRERGIGVLSAAAVLMVGLGSPLGKRSEPRLDRSEGVS